VFAKDGEPSTLEALDSRTFLKIWGIDRLKKPWIESTMMGTIALKTVDGPLESSNLRILDPILCMPLGPLPKRKEKELSAFEGMSFLKKTPISIIILGLVRFAAELWIDGCIRIRLDP